jgi:tetratricopeptide (TPR) repeat protein
VAQGSIRYSRQSETILRKAYALLGLTEAQLGRPQVAQAIFEEGLRRVGEDPELRFRLAQSHLEAGRNEEAIGQLTAIQPSTDGFFASIDLGILTFARLELLAEAYLNLGQIERAKEALAESIKANPRYGKAIVRLFEVCSGTADIKGARAALDHLLQAGGVTEDWVMLNFRLAEILDIPQEEALDRLVRTHPQAIAPKLILARSMLRSGQELAAQPLLRELMARGNAESAFNLGILAVKFNDLQGALVATTRSVQLEPANAFYQGQLESLQAKAEQDVLAGTEGDRGKGRLVGPHAGSLGKASCPRSVIVVTHYSAGTIRRCLTSALRSSAPKTN